MPVSSQVGFPTAPTHSENGREKPILPPVAIQPPIQAIEGEVNEATPFTKPEENSKTLATS